VNPTFIAGGQVVAGSILSARPEFPQVEVLIGGPRPWLKQYPLGVCSATEVHSPRTPLQPSAARMNHKRTRLAFRSMTTADQASSIPTSRKVLCVVYGVIAVAALIGTWSHIGPYLHSFTDFVGAEIGPCAGARTSTSAHEGAGHAARQTAVGLGAWTPRRSGVGAGDDDRRMTPAAWPMNRRTSRANRPNRPFRADSA
jgi:hypothetical protein